MPSWPDMSWFWRLVNAAWLGRSAGELIPAVTSNPFNCAKVSESGVPTSISSVRLN